jgi:hypothetical protein
MEMDWRVIMAGQRKLLLASLWLLGFLVAGCGPPTAIFVETTIHSDGSCDRMIWQPKDMFLPDGALKPEWNARWKTVSDASGRPGTAGSRASEDERKYFIAHGSFGSPNEIPPHYHYADQEVPDAGASELERAYARMDYGFVVEHRWQEKITNIVTLPGFLKARDELLDLFLPVYVEAIERIFGKDYNVSPLVNYLRADGRRFLENVFTIFWDAVARDRVMGEDGKLDGALTRNLLGEAERAGLDTNLLVGMFKRPTDEQESKRMLNAFLGRMVVRYFRHNDGSAVTATEADELIQAIWNNHRYEIAIQDEEKRIEERLQRDKQLDKRFKRAVLSMVGLYSFRFLFSAPEYEFTIRVPGELVETNGTRIKADRTRWKFTSDQLFPNGYQMKARSIEIDRDGQKKILGRVVIDDETKGMEFMELVGGEGPLLEAVRKLRQTGDRDTLFQMQTRTFDESLQVRKVRKMLFNEQAR